MAGIGTITKVLVAQEDLALGLGTVTQQRNNQAVTVNKLAIPLMYSNIEAIKGVDPSKVPIAKLVGNAIVEYFYSAASEDTPDDDNVLLPNSGIGRWLKLGIVSDYIATEVVEIIDENTIATSDDVGMYLRFTFVGAKSYTLSEVTTENGAEIHGRNDSEGNLTIIADGITISPLKDSSLVIPPNGSFILKHTEDADTWDLSGDTVIVPPTPQFSEVVEITNTEQNADVAHVGKFLRFTGTTEMNYYMSEVTAENGAEICGRNDSTDNLFIWEGLITISNPISGSKSVAPGNTFRLKHSEVANLWLMESYQPTGGGGGGGGIDYPTFADYEFSDTVNGITFSFSVWYLSSTAVHILLFLTGTPSGGGGADLKTDLPFGIRSELGPIEVWRRDYDAGAFANVSLEGNGDGTSTLSMIMGGAPAAMGGSTYNLGIFPIAPGGPA